MKYQAIITINIEGRDAYDVREQQEQLAALLEGLKSRFEDARLVVKARRPRTEARAAPPPKLGAGYEIIRVRHVG